MGREEMKGWVGGVSIEGGAWGDGQEEETDV